MKPSEMPRPFAPEHSDADDEADSLANQLHGTVKPMNADEKIAAKLQEQADELSRLTGQVKRLAKKNRMLEAGNRVKDEFLRNRQCPDHSGKWERGRCLQCEVEKLKAECERLRTLHSNYDLEELLRVYNKLHEGKVTAHWLWVAIERIGNGEPVVECLGDYGYIPEQRVETLQAQLDAVRGLPKYELHTNPYTHFLQEVDSEVGEWIKFSDLQQALNAPETA